MQERPGGPGTQVLTMRRFLIAVVSIAVLPAISFAQRGGMGGMGHAAVSAPHAAMAVHAAPSGAAHVSSGVHSYAGYPRYVRTRSGAVAVRTSPRVNSPSRTNTSNGSGRPLLSQDIVPGLGFDYPHLAAVHPNGINGRGRNGRFVGAYFPFYGGGYYWPIFPEDDTEEAPPAEAQATDNGQTESAQMAPRPGDYEPRQSRPSASKDTIDQEADQYVFVRRDGTLFFATAYAWDNGTLRYITAEGLRRTVTTDKLDLDATQQFNEQRGLTFHLPA